MICEKLSSAFGSAHVVIEAFRGIALSRCSSSLARRPRSLAAMQLCLQELLDYLYLSFSGMRHSLPSSADVNRRRVLRYLLIGIRYRLYRN